MFYVYETRKEKKKDIGRTSNIFSELEVLIKHKNMEKRKRRRRCQQRYKISQYLCYSCVCLWS